MKPKIKSLLRELEKTRSEYWNLAPETAEFINKLIKDRKFKSGLEIGTSNGYSGIWIAEALSQNNGHLYTIESHKKERFGLATKNFKKSGLSKYITQILGHAPEAIPHSKYDFALSDATKKETLKFFLTLAPLIKKSGIIITDNIASHRTELRNFLREVKKLPGWHHEELSIGSGILVSTKLN